MIIFCANKGLAFIKSNSATSGNNFRNDFILLSDLKWLMSKMYKLSLEGPWLSVITSISILILKKEKKRKKLLH
jgi:hypothetical protein